MMSKVGGHSGRPSMPATVRHRGLPLKIPNSLTAKVLEESKAGKKVKHFASRREIYADLGMRGPLAGRDKVDRSSSFGEPGGAERIR